MKRRVFVTGGAQGIGQSIVKAFCKAGDFVAFCDIDLSHGKKSFRRNGSRVLPYRRG